ncbi:hypothetical protein BT63DRAFT_271730 [Microthyrium microscopicum]|uniref:Uncharacterized protein n=1 Tax=Microthyrium microscopicum TaxID=703497 RepID=A0A6A6U7L0_9PEZI|nr:hypothetical protein BT63DRAFT_271730 [Microthyrium microscopicum]
MAFMPSSHPRRSLTPPQKQNQLMNPSRRQKTSPAENDDTIDNTLESAKIENALLTPDPLDWSLLQDSDELVESVEETNTGKKVPPDTTDNFDFSFPDYFSEIDLPSIDKADVELDSVQVTHVSPPGKEQDRMHWLSNTEATRRSVDLLTMNRRWNWLIEDRMHWPSNTEGAQLLFEESFPGGGCHIGYESADKFLSGFVAVVKSLEAQYPNVLPRPIVADLVAIHHSASLEKSIFHVGNAFTHINLIAHVRSP